MTRTLLSNAAATLAHYGNVVCGFTLAGLTFACFCFAMASTKGAHLWGDDEAR